MKRMLKVFTGLLVVFFLFNVASCKKDKEVKCKLTEWKYIETNGTSNYEDIYTMFYDSKDRLEKFQYEDDDYALFIYGSNGKLEKIEEHYGEEMDYLLFTWDGNTVTRQWYWQDGDTYNPSNSRYVLEYNTNNQILRMNEYYFNGTTEDYDLLGYSEFTWAGGNVTKVDYYEGGMFGKSMKARKSLRPSMARKAERLIKEHEISVKGITPDFEIYMSQTYSYDNRNNPFDMVIGMWEPWAIFISKNNVLTEQTIYYPDGGWENTFTYTYNSQNYPNIMTSVDGDWTTTWEFSYDCK